MIVALVRKTSVLCWMFVFSGMAISCSLPGPNSPTDSQSQPREGREKTEAAESTVGDLQIETWRCFARNDYNKATALFTLVRVRSGSEDLISTYGEVSVAGTTYSTSFRIAGLNRRWDFGSDESRDGYPYAFVIEPDGTGLYFDFSTSTDGTAKPRDFFECLMSP